MKQKTGKVFNTFSDANIKMKDWKSFGIYTTWHRLIESLLASLLVFIFLAIAILETNAQDEVSATFNPASIVPGEMAQYTIEIRGNNQLQGIPEFNIDGLDIQYIGQGSTFSTEIIINGRRTSNHQISYNFEVRATREGTFAIPEYTLKGESGNIVVPAATLSVVSIDKAKVGDIPLDQVVFLKINLPEKIYIGQVVYASLRVFHWSGADLVAYDMFEQQGDTLGQITFIEQPKRYRTTINSKEYIFSDYPVILRPVTAGEQSLRVDQQVTLDIPTGERIRTLFGMQSKVNRRKLVATTGDLKVEVLNPPEDNKPPGFGGAIGTFEANHKLSNKNARAGDPLTLTLSLLGSGNFDRIEVPSLINTDGWKIYPPKVNFEASNDYGDRGTKTFEYILIPLDETTRLTPLLQFSYFDPDKQRYFDLSVEPEEVHISPAPEDKIDLITTLNNQQGAGGQSVNRKRNPDYLPDIKLLPGKWNRSLTPLFRNGVFLGIQGLLAATFIIWGIIRKRQLRYLEDDDFMKRIKAGKSVRKWLKQAQTAAGDNQGGVFFAAAFRAIQECLGKHFSQAPESLTLDDLLQLLNTSNVEANQIELVQEICEMTDAIKFGGSALLQERNLSEWYGRLTSLISGLEGLK